MKVILHYIKPFIPRMSVGISIKFIGAVMELLLPWILSYLIDDIVPLRDIGLILLWGGAMVLAAVAALVTNIVANRIAAWVAQHTTRPCVTTSLRKSPTSPAPTSTATPSPPWNPA